MRPAGMVLLIATVLPFASAQETLPKGEEIMDRHITAIGGREAVERVKSDVRTSSMELRGRDMKFTVTSYRASPGKMYVVTEIPGMGKVEEGVDGEIAWSVAAARGAVLKEGVEREFAVYGAKLDAELNWRKWFPKAEVAGVEEFEGRACYKLTLSDPKGEQHTRYYDKETGLLSRLLLEVKLPQGKFPMDVRIYDYLEVGGVRVAHRTVRVMPGQEMESRIEKIEVNVEIDPARFTMPEAVKALVEKKSGS